MKICKDGRIWGQNNKEAGDHLGILTGSKGYTGKGVKGDTNAKNSFTLGGRIMTLKREVIFDIVTDPPCHHCEIGIIRVCEFWDVQGHYCFLKDVHSDTEKCPLVDKILKAHNAVIREILADVRDRNAARIDGL